MSKATEIQHVIPHQIILQGIGLDSGLFFLSEDLNGGATYLNVMIELHEVDLRLNPVRETDIICIHPGNVLDLWVIRSYFDADVESISNALVLLQMLDDNLRIWLILRYNLSYFRLSRTIINND